MTRERWEQVQEIFGKAVQFADQADRDSYLEDACKGQEELRAEVESLLYRHGKPGLNVYSSVGGKTLLHFELRSKLGEGGMGIVYTALDTRLNRVVAVKVLHPWMRLDSDERNHLVREAQHASALSHPNVVTVHDIHESNGVGFIVMEYVPGISLDQLIRTDGLPVEQALHYAVQMADGLAAAHSAGILHGDFTPRNVMVTADERVKLLDFGLARALAGARDERSSEVVTALRGTKMYMAPEQHVANPAFDVRAEIFSFGLVLYQMLSGRHPFDLGDKESIVEAIKNGRPQILLQRVSPRLVAIVERCLQKSPELRFRSVKDLGSTLSLCQDEAARPWTSFPRWAQSDSEQLWELKSIRSREEGKETIWRYSWKDIAWIGENEAWLCGEIDSGGPLGDIGTGVLLHTRDGGGSWTRIENEKFGSGRGSFSWGGNPQGWQDIGPIGSLHVYRRNLGSGKRQIEIWLAATSGVYRSDDGGQSWERSTPRPDERQYAIPHAHYGNLIRIVSSEEVFAVGWQGIAYWSAEEKGWSIQLPSCSYLITSIDAYPNDSPEWDVWAVGQSGDRRNPSHQIYHLNRPQTWERLPAEDIESDPAKGGLRCILMINYKTGFAVGPDGVIIKGTKRQDATWYWKALPKVTDNDLNSIVYADDTLWIVGNKGSVLNSRDMGQTWEVRSLKNEYDGLPSLNRIRCFNDSLWIMGNGVVYRRNARLR